jgi:putative transposase
VLLDEGRYYCSIRTMYRVLASRNEVRERRAQASHPPRVRPELVADGPDQVWTWDITKLKSQWRGLYFDLYVMLDIFSRKVIRWEVHATETGDLAKTFIENAIKSNGGTRPDYIHADNGTSMTSKPVSQLLSDLNIADSHSRPHVCPLTGQSQRFSRSATRRDVWGCLRGGDGGDTPVRHEHGESLAAA